MIERYMVRVTFASLPPIIFLSTGIGWYRLSNSSPAGDVTFYCINKNVYFKFDIMI